MVQYLNDFNEMTMTCDKVNCQDSEMFAGEFTQCIEDAKEAGWVITKRNEEWQHICPLCVNKENNPSEVFNP